MSEFNNQQIRVLLIEDSGVASSVIRNMLNESEDTSFIIERADSLSSGLDYLDGNSIDVVLLDLILPDSDGIQTFERVHARIPELPIIVLTGDDDGSMATKAVKQGAQDYLVKGKMDSNLLVHAIRYAIERKRVENEAVTRELRTAAEQADQMASQANSANKFRREFLSSINHEILTPMNGVIGMIGLLQDTNLDREQREYIEIARNSANSLLTIINNILDFSRFEQGKIDLDVIDFDLRTAVEEALDMLVVRADEKQLGFACVFHHDVPFKLRGDPARLQQVLFNLTVNAIRFTDRGEVSIICELEQETESKAKIQFSVTDTGAGIPQDRIDYLFQSLPRVGDPVTQEHGGNGLGLPISKKLVEMMGGEIKVESIEGVGSKFRFTCVFDKQPEQRQAPDIAERDFQDTRVLVMDERALYRRALKEQFMALGCHFEESLNESQTLHKLNDAVNDGAPYDVVILGAMAEPSGQEALSQKIREDSKLKNTKLVKLTTIGKFFEDEHSRNGAFNVRLLAPIKHLHLLDCLRTCRGDQIDDAEASIQPSDKKYAQPHDTRRLARILLVEDSIVNQKIALRILEKAGYKVDAVFNGREAIEVLAKSQYDLVLMDVQMPEMNGIEATRAIRKKEEKTGRHVPIFAMTANVMQEDREECLGAGMDGYLSKPVEPQKLLDVLDTHLLGAISSQPETESEGKGTVEPIFDRDAFLKRLDGDEELCKEILEIYLEDAPRIIERIKAALKDNDSALVDREGHTLKGASANVSALAVREVALQIEMAGKAGELDNVDSLIELAEAKFENLKDVVSSSGF